MTGFNNLLKNLRHNKSGVVLIEFAYTIPLVLTVVMSGTELTRYALMKMSMNQTALQLVDNASRMGDDVSTPLKPISEGDIDDSLIGAGMQFDSTNGLYRRGRVILSSVEPDPVNAGKSRIRWQRCRGLKQSTSSYGVSGAANLAGVGPSGRQVVAPTGGAVMFAEIIYDYEPFFLDGWLDYETLSTTAAMTVRDPRDFTAGTNGVVPVANVYNNCQYYRTDSLNG